MEDLINRYISSLKKLDSKEYTFNIILTVIATSICGVKCGSLVNITSKSKKMREVWQEEGEEFLDCLELNSFIVNEDADRLLIYFYSKKLLKNMLDNTSVRAFLRNFGYPNSAEINDILEFIKYRFKGGLPHEIGLFLGIPLEDVEGFITNKGENYLYCGYWKVYSNIDYCMKIFELYSNLRKEVMNLIAEEYKFLEILEYLQNRQFIN